MKTRIALFIGALCAMPAQADAPLEFNMSGQAVFTRIKAADENFSPKLFQLKAGVELTDSALAGVGLQAMVGLPIADSTKNNFTIDIDAQHGAYLTLTDPTAAPDAVKFVLYVGYATTKLEVSPDFTGGSANRTFDGTSYGFSLQQRIYANKPWAWSLDCTRFYRDSNMRIDGCGVGANYEV